MTVCVCGRPAVDHAAVKGADGSFTLSGGLTVRTRGAVLFCYGFQDPREPIRNPVWIDKPPEPGHGPGGIQ
jgi:hypothetical protein